jgi:hypothetical protein
MLTQGFAGFDLTLFFHPEMLSCRIHIAVSRANCSLLVLVLSHHWILETDGRTLSDFHGRGGSELVGACRNRIVVGVVDQREGGEK